MCGIFGLAIKKDSPIKLKSHKITKDLFVFSESRGKEASGFAYLNENNINYFKAPYSAKLLIKNQIFKSHISNLSQERNDFIAIGHSRLVTNGYEQNNLNNQPIIKKDTCLVHNGIVTNHKKLWKNIIHSKKESDLDSEVIPSILNEILHENISLKSSYKRLFKSIYGMSSIAVIHKNYNNLILATNNGSLYYVSDKKNESFLFASESLILKKLIKKQSLEFFFDSKDIVQLKPNTILNLNLSSFQSELLTLEDNDEFKILKASSLEFNEIISSNVNSYVNNSLDHSKEKVPEDILKFIEIRTKQISSLKRCTKCLLPESFPRITFDSNGVCSVCENYVKNEFKGLKSLKEIINIKSKSNGVHDCLVPFSGGRDSCFLLHFLKKELNLNPLAFSYDWGMITDLGRRNQARMCDRLNIEHIYISADIRKKRRNINKNVSAWLKKPNLGTIPLFMAGDKHYFYFTKKLQKDYDLDLVIMGENRLEKTGFKTSFSGASQSNSGSMAYNIDNKNKIKMIFHYAKAFISNPNYINSSLFNTFSAFTSYYASSHNYLNLFDFIDWDEDKINNTLINDYSWEIDPETPTTWRIGDGTAAFYNYIYFLIAGFTENDTFRSNQIREGLITRDQGLAKVKLENEIRWSSFQWYCKTIGLDWVDAVNTINKVKPIFTDYISR